MFLPNEQRKHDWISFSCNGGRDSFGKLTLARRNAHSHNFKADVSLTPFLALFDSVMVAGRTPFSARPVFPKKKNEEEATAVRMARLDGSVTRRINC